MKKNTILAKTDKILYGADYNPEQWPESVWKEDMRLMRQAGVNTVSIGIFSWAKLQPDEKTYAFGWLDRLMDLLAENGIWADLATGTASPPPWMSRYPDLAAVDADGLVYSHGSRQHFSPSSPTYRKFAAALVKRIAARYAKHPALAGWHINNEYACHMSACHGEVSTRAFRVWLKKRYGSIERLNEAWGTAFWSQHYYDWDEVLTPRRTPMFPNPSQSLDFHRFCNDTFWDLCKMELDILRRATPDIPITTNFMGFFKPLNYHEWSKDLDFVCWDAYPDPLPGLLGPMVGARGHDLTRSLKPGRPFVLMEQVTSHVNWRPVNVAKPPGVMRLWSLQAVARGSDGILFFQWRQAAFGAEKYHGAMVQHGADLKKSRVFREVCGLGADLGKLGEITGSVIKSRVAIYVDWESWWALELPSKPVALNFLDLIEPFHRFFFERNIAVDFVGPDSKLDGYALVVAPAAYLLSQKEAQRLDRFVVNGGALFTTCFNGIVDESERIVTGGYPGYLRETLGLWVEEWWPLGPEERRKVKWTASRRQFSGHTLSETIHADGARVIATFADGPVKGRPALLCNSRGKGSAFYMGTLAKYPELTGVLETIRNGLKLGPPIQVPLGIEVTLRESESGKFLFLLNHNKGAARIKLGRLTGNDLLTGRKARTEWKLPANEAAVIKLD